jgi:hypothetical protein
LANNADKKGSASFLATSLTEGHPVSLKNVINLRNVETEEAKLREDVSFVKSETVDLHNMTFFNAKSSCLPPIKKI